MTPTEERQNPQHLPHKALGSRVAQRSKALHLSARGVITDPGLIPGCMTTGRDWPEGGAQLAQRCPG